MYFLYIFEPFCAFLSRVVLFIFTLNLFVLFYLCVPFFVLFCACLYFFIFVYLFFVLFCAFLFLSAPFCTFLHLFVSFRTFLYIFVPLCTFSNLLYLFTFVYLLVILPNLPNLIESGANEVRAKRVKAQRNSLGMDWKSEKSGLSLQRTIFQSDESDGLSPLLALANNGSLNI